MISVNFTPDDERELRQAFGANLDEAIRLALIAEAFRVGRLSIGQVARLLGSSIDESHAFLKRRGADQALGIAEVEAEASEFRSRIARAG